MTDQIAPDLCAWLVLRRVQWDSVAIDEANGAVYDHGQGLAMHVGALVPRLAERGYVRLGDPVAELPPCRRVHLTTWGERLFELLDDLRRCWLARQRAGLPRCHADLDTLGLMLEASTIHFGPPDVP